MLKNAFDTFDVEKKGSIGTVMIGTILGMLGIQTTETMLDEIIAEVDADGGVSKVKFFAKLKNGLCLLFRFWGARIRRICHVSC